MSLFVTTFVAKYPKAAECLTKDREALLPQVIRGVRFVDGIKERAA